MEKDLKFLNTKSWYRLIKIIYIFVFAVTLIISISTVISSYKPKLSIDQYNPDIFKQTILNIYPNAVTASGIRYADIPASELLGDYLRVSPDGITSDGFNFTPYPITLAQLKNNINVLQNRQVSNDKIQNYVNLYKTDKNGNFVSNISQNNRLEKYKFIAYYWFSIIGLLLFSIIIISIAFEFIRRIFYYIVLGSFLPEKPKRYLFFKIKYKE
jgi:hypothetical protein